MKHPFIYIALLGAFTLAGCSQSPKETASMTQENPICSGKNVVGGWSKKDITSEAQEALDFALNSMVTDARLTKVLSVRSQVVSGVNYAIEFEMDNGEVYHTIVYRALDDEMSLTQPVERGKVCP